MNAHGIMTHLNTHACAASVVFGVVRGHENVLAFGWMSNGQKIRIGSIVHEEDSDRFTVIQFPGSQHEFHAGSLVELGWFLWKLSEVKDWDEAEDWMYQSA